MTRITKRLEMNPTTEYSWRCNMSQCKCPHIRDERPAALAAAHNVVTSPEPFTRTIHIIGYQPLAIGKLKRDLGLLTEDGRAEAWFAGIYACERITGVRQVRVDAEVNYGVSFNEERIWSALEGY
jgi:hypothetical protein